jgi:hypothetical protein
MISAADRTAVSTPQTILDDAWARLDTAVRSLREIDDDTVMADAGLLALVHQVANAQRLLIPHPWTTGSPGASLA